MTPRVPPNMQPPRRTLALALLCAFASTPAAQADTITIGDTRHDNVYISQSAALYYISDPETGSTISIAKDSPALGPVEISDDADDREALLARYKDARKQLDPPKVSDAPIHAPPSIVVQSNAIPSDLYTPPSSQSAPGHSSTLIVGRGDRPVKTITAWGPTTARSPSGFSGTQGGSRATTGGRGGNQGGAAGQRTGAGSNISGLFSSVGDSSVGESPNPITGR